MNDDSFILDRFLNSKINEADWPIPAAGMALL
jgi:hypothetical protein